MENDADNNKIFSHNAKWGLSNTAEFSNELYQNVVPDLESETFVARLFIGSIEVDKDYVEYAFRSMKNGGGL
jgi:hypothetical protein